MAIIPTTAMFVHQYRFDEMSHQSIRLLVSVGLSQPITYLVEIVSVGYLTFDVLVRTVSLQVYCQYFL